MSYAVVYPNSTSAGSAAGSADSADFVNSAIAAAVLVTAFELVPDLVDVLPSLALLTGTVLYSLNLGSSAHLLLVYLFYFFNLLFLTETVLVFLACLAIL